MPAPHVREHDNQEVHLPHELSSVSPNPSAKIDKLKSAFYSLALVVISNLPLTIAAAEVNVENFIFEASFSAFAFEI